MFDVGWQELALIGAVALVVIGPKELPGALRALGHLTYKAKGVAREFRAAFDEALDEAEIADFKQQAMKAAGVTDERDLLAPPAVKPTPAKLDEKTEP